MVTNLSAVSLNTQRSDGTYGPVLSVMWDNLQCGSGTASEVVLNGIPYADWKTGFTLWPTWGTNGIVCEGEQIAGGVAPGQSFEIHIVSHYANGTVETSYSINYVVPMTFTPATSAPVATKKKGK